MYISTNRNRTKLSEIIQNLNFEQSFHDYNVLPHSSSLFKTTFPTFRPANISFWFCHKVMNWQTFQHLLDGNLSNKGIKQCPIWIWTNKNYVAMLSIKVPWKSMWSLKDTQKITFFCFGCLSCLFCWAVINGLHLCVKRKQSISNVHE